MRHCGLLNPTQQWLGTGGQQVIDDEPSDIPGRSGHQDRHGSSLLSTVNQIVVPRLTEDGRWKMASFVLRLPSSVQKVRFDALSAIGASAQDQSYS